MKGKALTLMMAISVFVIISTAAFCQQVYDPNAGSASTDQSENKGDLISDPRLSVKITYSAKKVPVRTVVDNLMEASKVVLRAGTTNKDWEVRDRKINVYAKETSLRDIMNAISRVTGFKWSISGQEEKATYRLVWDANTREEMAAKRAADEQAAEQMITAMRKAGIDSMASLDNLSQDDKDKLRAENPFLFYMAASGIGQKFNGFLNSSPNISSALLNGQAMTLNGSDLSAQARSNLSNLLLATKSVETKMRGGNPSDVEAPDLSNATISVNQGGGRGGRGIPRGMRQNMLGSIMVRTDKGFYMVPLFNPKSRSANAFGKAMIEADLLNRPFGDVMKEMQGDMRKAFMDDMRAGQQGDTGGTTDQTTTTTADGKPVTDPVLDANIKINLTGQSIADVEEEIAKTTGITIVSDNFNNRPQFGPQGSAGQQDTTLRKLLIDICGRFEYKWNKITSPIEFQDSAWLEKIPTLIPDELLDSWKKTLKETGTLTIQQLAQISLLSQEQFQANVTSDEVLRMVNLQGVIYPNRDLLQLIGSMSDSQIRSVFSQNGYNLRNISTDIIPLAKKALSRNPALLENKEVPLIMTAKLSQQDKSTVVNITVTTNEQNIAPATWQITLPTYDANAPVPQMGPRNQRGRRGG